MAYLNDTTQEQTRARSERSVAVLSATLAILFGLFLVWGVGFASPMTIHNAAHDSRHSFAFPCH
ncbi:cobalt transporter subunit CbtB [Tistlia consotensis]|uniref:Cobalt transporter subunit CbtB n=1 Tax=Tistlia consotensis USBA 355 TaxID=560819 RepID=A0A1Y6B360_9PROT|nr:CbtB domain-containing protein [Tistlia consotensis]SME87815.1 cobalt transporter subunit CbtB [Tistlia consotensis USBA 355]SNR24180.1 cobalt transporter subunit CbtB [Tistlia consotensis]